MAFTFSLLIKICTTASKFYSFLRTSISIYRKKWKSAVYGEASGLAKLLSPLPTEGGKKCCRRVSGVLIAMSGKSFPCCGQGVEGAGWRMRRHLCGPDMTVLLWTLIQTHGCYAAGYRNGTVYVIGLMISLFRL